MRPPRRDPIRKTRARARKSPSGPSAQRPERAAADSGESRVNISPAGAAAARPPAPVESALDLAFAAADGNRDGTVTMSEQKTYEVRTVRINIVQPADGRPGPAGSGPIRAYRDVGATIAGI